MKYFMLLFSLLFFTLTHAQKVYDTLDGTSPIPEGKLSVFKDLNLEAGYYIMECYINGIFHSAMGIVAELIITENISENQAPEGHIKIMISSTGGIDCPDTIPGGRQTFAVQFPDQVVHENFAGYDVNLIKPEEGMGLHTLEKWMNRADPEGLITPAPEGFTF